MPKFHSRSYLRWSFVALWRAVLLGSLACTAFPKSVIDPEALGIAVGVEQRQVGDEWHPVAVVSIQNVSPHRIAFTKTFGITNQSWMSFAIEASDGSTVYYPSEVDVFTARPKYFCLQPGEVLVWELDLLSWDVLFGGESWGGPFAFDLKRGLYRLQVQYTDHPARVKARCPGLSGTASSNWVEFSVAPEAPQR